MIGKTDITPIIDNLQQLKGSDVKVLNVLYQYGCWLDPDRIAIESGLCKRSVQRSLERPLVKQLICCIEKKSDLDKLLMQQRAEFKRLLDAEKNGQNVQE